MTTINFSEYSDDELLQSLQSIDRESYPDNFRRLISELKKRRDQKPVEPEAPVHDSGDTFPLIPDKPSRKTGVITLVVIAVVIVAVLMVSNRPVVQQETVAVPAAVTEQGQALVDEIAAVALPLTRLQIDTDHPDKADALKALLDRVTLTWVAAADGAAPAIAIDLTTGAFADTALNEQLFGILKPQISSALQQRL